MASPSSWGKKTIWWKILELTTFIDSFSFAKQFPYVSWTIGNNVSFRREVLLEIGMFEENLPFKLGGDDLDMTYRVTKAGYCIKTVPEAVTFHSRDTWNSWKAVNDRSKRWGSMEYHILKRHPELIHRRLPMTGGRGVLYGGRLRPGSSFSSVLAAGSFLGRLVLYPVWNDVCVLREESREGESFYWSAGHAAAGKIPFPQLLMSLKMRDLSLAFKGQYFGIYHIQSDFRMSARKVWLYYESIFLILLIIIGYKFIMG